MNKLFILAAVCALVFGVLNAIEFKDCGSQTGKFTKMIVSNCDETSPVCVLKRHTNASFELDFDMIDGGSVPQVTTVVHGIILGVEMPFPLKNPNACVDSGITCPLEKDINYEYKQSLPVLKSYPKVTVTVKWELKDIENNKTIICVLIPAKIE